MSFPITKNVGPIRHNEPPHAHSADVASGSNEIVQSKDSKDRLKTIKKLTNKQTHERTNIRPIAIP